MHRLLPAVAPVAAVLVGLLMVVTGPPRGAGTAPDACSVAYRVTEEWAGGFASYVTVINTGDATIDKWSLRWTFPAGQTATEVREGKHTSQVTLRSTASTVVVRSTPESVPLPPQGQAIFGLSGTTGDDATVGDNGSPEMFVLNGTTCTLA